MKWEEVDEWWVGVDFKERFLEIYFNLHN